MRLAPIVCSAAAIITLSAGTVLLPAASAHALSLGTLACTGAEQDLYSPALTNTASAGDYVTTQDTVGSCLSTDTSITGGVGYINSIETGISCTTLLAAGTGVTTFIWSNGNYSTFSYDQTTTAVNGELITTQRGTIISGEFEGSLAVQVNVLPTLDLTACENGGISSANGTVAFTILL
ncbi:MAG TPA: hypothetical protein VN969_38660 [Streptosporangiaceae bacterium]|nr:hypothetical protein [Streptosporangiaceae bacterium]